MASSEDVPEVTDSIPAGSLSGDLPPIAESSDARQAGQAGEAGSGGRRWRRKRGPKKSWGKDPEDPRQYLPPTGAGMPRAPGGGPGNKKKFIYGNYDRYYGYRVGDHISQDTRVKWLQKGWFEGKTCLDIGCNEGALTIYIAKEYDVSKMVGVEIDRDLVFEARKRLRQVSREQQILTAAPPSSQGELALLVARWNAPIPAALIPAAAGSPAVGPSSEQQQGSSSSHAPDSHSSGVRVEPGTASTEQPPAESEPNGSDINAEPGTASAAHPQPGSGVVGSQPVTAPTEPPAQERPQGGSPTDPSPAIEAEQEAESTPRPELASSGPAPDGQPVGSVPDPAGSQQGGDRMEEEASEGDGRHSGGAPAGDGTEASQSQSGTTPSWAQVSARPSEMSWDALPGSCPALEEKVRFLGGNVLAMPVEEGTYDTVLCLSVTKWVHLNWGDRGLINLFKKIYSALRKGGLLLLEPQPWRSYTKNRNVSKIAMQHYSEITIRPEDFRELLLDKIGFQKCSLITDSVDSKKGFGRPLFLLTK